MSVINTLNLTVAFGEKTVLNNIGIEVNCGEKVGLVGVNGAGKTTLLKVITGEISDYTGTFVKGKDVKIGYMEQHSCSEKNNTVYEELLETFQALIDIGAEIEALAGQLENRSVGDNANEAISEMTRLTDIYNNNGGLTYVSRTKATLRGLGFGEAEFSMHVDKLSGGQRSKLILAKLLLSDNNLLLLDEPTNHLDISAVNWLEAFLRDYKGSALIISHDRYFLDRVTNKTIEIQNSKTVSYTGNYSDFLTKKKKIQQDIQDKYDEDLQEIHRIEAIVAQQRQWNREKNIKTAESKLKQIERIRASMVEPEKAEEKIHFDFSPKNVSGNDVLFVDGLSKVFGEKKIFGNISFSVKKGEKIFLLGPNGCGKTTLLKVLTGDYEKSAGNFTFGANVQTGYFDQVQDKLDLSKTAVDEVWDSFPALNQTQIRNSLASFLFKGDDVFKLIGKMSGGERARIALLKLMLGGYNFLLLDEPTNHLDAFSREQLEETLCEYDGTMIVVSHDRYFINKLADKIFYMSDHGIKEYSGNYDYFAEKSNVQNNSSIFKKSEKKLGGGNDYKARKELQSNIRKVKTQIAHLEGDIEKTENAIARCRANLISEEYSADYEKLTEESKSLDQYTVDLDEMLEKWEELHVYLQEFLQNQ